MRDGVYGSWSEETMRRQKIEKALLEAWKQAEDYQEGSIVIQLAPNNRSIITSWQLGNSWESMGLGASESQDRILESFDCRDFEPVYLDDEPDYRLDAEEQDHDNFEEIIDEINSIIEDFKK